MLGSMRIKAVRLPPPQWWYRVKPDPSFDPLVADVRAHAEKIDSRAFWKAWGTSRTEDTRQTPLGPWRPPQAQPEVSQPTPKRRRAKAPVVVDSYRHPEVRR